MNESKNRKPNQLIHEKSPYLLQHAYNPVDWYPWKEEAFEKAKREDKPIFLSIGYSTCHWCHVMAKESFEDEEAARLLNETFVCIKVDREERPDIDSTYMAVCQLMTGSGGWPLTIIMTPDKRPFFAATYIPKTSRFELIGILDLIPKVREIWLSRKQEAEDIGEQVRTNLEKMDKRMQDTILEKDKINAAYESLVLNFDEKHGGFGNAPKFPTPGNLLFLLRYWKRTGKHLALAMVEKTLRSMRAGGIYDHVGFGFHRYSTDSRWIVPHFEKMLYDQALLTMAYVECFQATGKDEYKQTAQEILEYVMRDMTSPEGVFYSAEDADSENEEGKFYLWTEEQIRNALPQKETADLAVRIFSIKRDGNFEEMAKTETGRNVLHHSRLLEELAQEMSIPLDKLRNQLLGIRSSLYKHRGSRVHPQKDDKVLVDWNGLMIAAFAKAAQVFDESKYLLAAKKSADFILEKTRDKNGRLYHCYRNGEAYLKGFLDDYAFLSWGLIELYEACFETRYLKSTLELTEIVLTDFWDKTLGGFYQTAEYAEEVLRRNRQIHEGALPSGNSVATLNLLRIAGLTADIKYEESAAKTIQAFSETIASLPEAHPFMLLALDFALGPRFEIVMVGNPDSEDTKEMLTTMRRHYAPFLVLLFRTGEDTTDTQGIFKHLASYRSLSDRATAYVCSRQICNQPTNNLDKLTELVDTQCMRTSD